MARRQSICFLLVWILVLWNSGYVGAEPKTIDFDYLPDGTPIAHDTPITDAYAEWGVTLNCFGTYPDDPLVDDNNAYAYEDDLAYSGNNVMGGRITGDALHWLNFFLCYGSAEFEEPVDMFRIYGAGDSFELAYYNQDGVRRGLGDSVVGHISSSGNSFLEISTESGYLISGDVIKRVEFGSIPGNYYTYFDDLTFCSFDSDGDGIYDDGDGSGTAGDNPCTGGETVNCDDNCPNDFNPDQTDNDADGIGDVCDSPITELVPSQGGYGTKIKVKGPGFGSQRSGMFNATQGYYSFITFTDATDTMIATKYPVWSDAKIKVKFKDLFIDQDGDYLQDQDEIPVEIVQLDLVGYATKVNTIWFTDNNSNSVYDEGDSIDQTFSSNPLTFTLTDDPVIYTLIPASTPPSQPGVPQIVKIKGLNFGGTQGSSSLHIGGKTWSVGHPKIKVWQDDKIKFKVPKYGPPFPKYKDIWVTVNGVESNKLQLEITAP